MGVYGPALLGVDPYGPALLGVGVYRPALLGVKPEIRDVSLTAMSPDLPSHVGLELEFYVFFQVIMVQALVGLSLSSPENLLDSELNVVRLFACSDQVMVV